MFLFALPRRDSAIRALVFFFQSESASANNSPRSHEVGPNGDLTTRFSLRNRHMISLATSHDVKTIPTCKRRSVIAKDTFRTAREMPFWCFCSSMPRVGKKVSRYHFESDFGDEKEHSDRNLRSSASFLPEKYSYDHKSSC